MRIWSWTVDDWNAAFQILPIVFLVLTVLTAVGKFWTDRIIKERNARELAAARSSAAKLETDLAKQHERTANAERQLLEVQERFKRRTMSPREQSDLVASLRVRSSLAREAREKNGETLWIVHPSGDTEATEFASMLTGLFVQAGWQPNLRDVPLHVHMTGIVIMVRDANNLPLLAQALKQALVNANIPFAVQSEPNTDKRTWLVVGSKQ